MDVGKMRRVYFLQQRYGLADEALEDALCDSLSSRAFLGLAGGNSVPDTTTLLHFRPLLEAHQLTKHLGRARISPAPRSGPACQAPAPWRSVSCYPALRGAFHPKVQPPYDGGTLESL